MLKMCVNLCGSDERNDDVETRIKKQSAAARARASVDSSIQSRKVSVRIVHAGGQEELYENVVPASQLMEKYRGMCIARPEVFKNPEGSLLRPDENLLPGHKYYMIPSSTAQKLKHKHLGNVQVKRIAEINELSRVRRRTSHSQVVKRNSEVENGNNADANITWDLDKEISDESFSSARDFYAREMLPGQSSRNSPQQSPKRQAPRRPPRQTTGQFQRQGQRRGGRMKKPFVPPLPRIRTCRGIDWEPSLSSIQEVSP